MIPKRPDKEKNPLILTITKEGTVKVTRRKKSKKGKR